MEHAVNQFLPYGEIPLVTLYPYGMSSTHTLYLLQVEKASEFIEITTSNQTGNVEFIIAE